MRLLMFVVLLLISQLSNAACLDNSKYSRKCYDHTNAPLEVIYKIFVTEIFLNSTAFLEDLDRIEDSNYPALRRVVNAGLTPNMRSADVVRYFVSQYLKIEKETEEIKKQLLCLDGKPRYQGAENFVIFNQMEEVSLNVYEKHFFFARSDLQASGLFDLDKALREYPASFGFHIGDYRKAFDGSAKRIYEAAVDKCESP